MNGLKHIIKLERDDYMLPSYYICEPVIMPGGINGGGFGDMNKAVVFDNIVLAQVACKRLSEIYSDIPVEMKVVTITTKELFKARLMG